MRLLEALYFFDGCSRVATLVVVFKRLMEIGLRTGFVMDAERPDCTSRGCGFQNRVRASQRLSVPETYSVSFGESKMAS